ncbi:Helitron helicase-like protein [Phytophthora palmivora]|uniref:Helitron helicase-like protein n=1 Tax=Phytophthora palmivora TaxID=4796 RepID=A0A2P4XGL0_9STRA|nr:Helitron helicase-like protein [Phytophthora palmivora]
MLYSRRWRSTGRPICGRKECDNETVNQWVLPILICATSKAIKYIYNYVYKGADVIMVTIEGEIQGHSLNEILQYLLARYILPVEACMRLFKHPTQGSTHNVVKLAIHLPEQSAATYRAHASNAQIRRSGWKMLYKDIPTVYRWDKKSKWWAQYKNTFLLSVASYMFLHKIQNGFTCDCYCVIETGLLPSKI